LELSRRTISGVFTFALYIWAPFTISPNSWRIKISDFLPHYDILDSPVPPNLHRRVKLNPLPGRSLNPDGPQIIEAIPQRCF
jgi:hypothetical protein